MRMFLLLSFLFSGNLLSQYEIDFEAGMAFTGYNDVRIPGNSGTLFSLQDDLSPDATFFTRLRFSRQLGERHFISLLFAPLRIKAVGAPNRDILYEGEVFERGVPLTGNYRFDSYRITYRYEFYDNGRFSAGAGLTGKIRDAEIRLTDGAKEASKKNTGFVPLVNFRLDFSLGRQVDLVMDGDALAAPQGRAEDIFFGVLYSPADDLGFKAGYRVLEGGADNDEVYNFTLVNYVSAGIVLQI
ncbi:hypothetical protein JXA84_05320 [candidate division WOR-3 bacterium]|nr:hypothetical protein [candidate division WOR-3 bacterium]